MYRQLLYLRYSLAKIRDMNFDLAEELGVTKPTLSKWWRGNTSHQIDEVSVRKILDKYSVPNVRIE